jgi:hypothetical protein
MAEATCRGTVYPWRCDPSIRETAMGHLLTFQPAMA